MTETNYTTRSMRRRRGTDKWEVTLSHTNPVTGETVRTYHAIGAKTQRQAERKRDALERLLDARESHKAASRVTSV
jgi:hypothetical protein